MTLWRMDEADETIQDTAREIRCLYRHARGETIPRIDAEHSAQVMIPTV